MGLFKKDAKEYLAEIAKKTSSDIPAEVIKLAESRWTAKTAKNWAEADRLRAEIDRAGFTVKDGKDGFRLIRK